LTYTGLGSVNAEILASQATGCKCAAQLRNLFDGCDWPFRTRTTKKVNSLGDGYELWREDFFNVPPWYRKPDCRTSTHGNEFSWILWYS